MDLPTVRGLLTAILMLAFVGVVIWAWSSKRKKDFDDAANIPFNEDGPSKSDSMSKENSHG